MSHYQIPGLGGNVPIWDIVRVIPQKNGSIVCYADGEQIKTKLTAEQIKAVIKECKKHDY